MRCYERLLAMSLEASGPIAALTQPSSAFLTPAHEAASNLRANGNGKRSYHILVA